MSNQLLCFVTSRIVHATQEPLLCYKQRSSSPTHSLSFVTPGIELLLCYKQSSCSLTHHCPSIAKKEVPPLPTCCLLSHLALYMVNINPSYYFLSEKPTLLHNTLECAS